MLPTALKAVHRPSSTLQPVILKHRSARLSTSCGLAELLPLSLGPSSNLYIRGQHLLVVAQVHGTGFMRAHEGSFALVRGDWIVIGPDSDPDIHIDQDGQAIGVVIGMGGHFDLFNNVSPFSHIFPGSGRFCFSHLQQAKRQCLWAWRAITTKSDISRAQVANFARTLVSLQSDLHPLIVRCPGRSMRRRREVLWRLQKARMLMEGSYERSVSLDELAVLTGISSWHLSRTFKQVYGETIREAQGRIRMRHAEVMLANPGQSVCEIAKACGYPDASTFARAFKEYHGMTASTWRSVRERWKLSDSPGPLNDYPVLLTR